MNHVYILAGVFLDCFVFSEPRKPQPKRQVLVIGTVVNIVGMFTGRRCTNIHLVPLYVLALHSFFQKKRPVRAVRRVSSHTWIPQEGHMLLSWLGLEPGSDVDAGKLSEMHTRRRNSSWRSALSWLSNDGAVSLT